MIPPMTDPLGRHWDQPSHATFVFDDTHVLMSNEQFEALAEYSTTLPSGMYQGKMWKSQAHHGLQHGRIAMEEPERWFLHWYFDLPNDPKNIGIGTREILVLEKS